MQCPVKRSRPITRSMTTSSTVTSQYSSSLFSSPRGTVTTNGNEQQTPHVTHSGGSPLERLLTLELRYGDASAIGICSFNNRDLCAAFISLIRSLYSDLGYRVIWTGLFMASFYRKNERQGLDYYIRRA